MVACVVACDFQGLHSARGAQNTKNCLHYLFRAATMSSYDLPGTLTSLISVEIQTMSELSQFRLNAPTQTDLQGSDIYLWLWNIKESGNQLQILLSKYLKEVWPGSCSKQSSFFWFFFSLQQCRVQKFKVFCNNSGKLCSRCWRSGKWKISSPHEAKATEALNEEVALDKRTLLAVDPIGLWLLLTSYL